MPGACRSCLRAHKLLWLRARQGKWFFSLGMYTTFTGLVLILAGHAEIFAGHVNFQNHVPDGHVNQMLNVKPCTVHQCHFTEIFSFGNRVITLHCLSQIGPLANRQHQKYGVAQGHLVAPMLMLVLVAWEQVLSSTDLMAGWTQWCHNDLMETAYRTMK